MKKLASQILILSTLACHSLLADVQPSFDEWAQTIHHLPTNRSLGNSNAAATAGLTVAQFQDLLSTFNDAWQKEIATSTWQDGALPAGRDENFFVEKLVIPAGSRVAFHGDLHGDIQSLMAFIAGLRSKGILSAKNGFQIVSDDFYIVFHGDYTDRGRYGTEVLATAIRLKLANPNRVFLVRGNHEDHNMNRRDGFYSELQAKYGSKNASILENDLSKFYAHLPVALFLGVKSADQIDYLLCVHGGIELGFDHTQFLQPNSQAKFAYLGALDRAKIFKDLPPPIQQTILSSSELKADFRVIKDPTTLHIGFLWNDFILNTKVPILQSTRNTESWEVGKSLTEYYLQQPIAPTVHLRGVIRAHQHGDQLMMAKILKKDDKNEIQKEHPNLGIAKLWTDDPAEGGQTMWDNIVVTLNVGADTVYANYHKFDFHTVAILQTKEQFGDWQLTPMRVFLGS